VRTFVVPARATLVALLCLTASAAADPPAAPAGYERSAEGDVWIFRPAGDKDAALDIRLLPAADAPRGGVALLRDWMAANPGGAAQEPTEPEPRIAAVIREATAGGQRLQQAIIAVKTPPGRWQILVVSLPVSRAQLAESHLAAAGELGKQLVERGPADVPASGAAAPARDARRLAGAIATVGFYTKTGMGVGGMLTFNPTPVVLFKSGDALKRMEALKQGDSVDALKAASPRDWTRWRRAGGVLELEKDGKWSKLDFQKTMDALPRGFKLDGRYQKLGGGGNAAIGGPQSVTTWSELVFGRDGGFASSGGASVDTRAGDTRSFAAGERPGQSGRYEIDGYVLILRHADGRVEQRLLVTDVSDLSVVWVDGQGYVKQ
jgi:hypothetical protein